MEIKIPKVKRGRRTSEQTLQYEKEMNDFANSLKEKQKEIVKPDGLIMKISARGWCYLLEGWKAITKDQFDQTQKLINTCRKTGLLPIDFVARDEARSFNNVEELSEEYKNPKEFVNDWLETVRKVYNIKEDVAFWESQDCYIQMMVEKIDVKVLFSEICEKYHVPINNAKGWSDLHSRNELAQRFKEAEEKGLKPILLYYGDFDPAGILISDILKNNMKQIEKATGWNSDNLTVDRFGLTIDFIKENNLLWIDNLMTGGKKELNNPKHPDHNKAYVQEYLKKYGVRKCEANAILPISNIAIDDCEKTILKYLGDDCFEVYDKKIKEIQQETKNALKTVNFKQRISELMNDIDNIDLDSI